MTPKGKVTSWPNLVKISHRKVDKITSDFADKRNPAACNSSKSAIFPALRRSHPKFPERCRRLNLRVSAAYFDPDSLGFAGVISKIVFFRTFKVIIIHACRLKAYNETREFPTPPRGLIPPTFAQHPRLQGETGERGEGEGEGKGRREN